MVAAIDQKMHRRSFTVNPNFYMPKVAQSDFG